MRAFLAVIAVAGCSSNAAGGSVDGAQIFQAVCSACHGPTGKPNDAMIARLGVRDLTAADLRAKITPELVARQVRDGSKNKLMPAFAGALNDDQIDAVAHFVASPQFLAPK